MQKFLAALMLVAIAMASPAAEDARPTPRAPPKRIPAPALDHQPAGQPITTAEMPAAVRRAVVADAARRFKVPASSVVLTGAEKVTWPDAALGCPEPGSVYAQTLVPGYRVAARTTAGELQYHTDTHGEVRNCATHEGPRLPQPDPER